MMLSVRKKIVGSFAVLLLSLSALMHANAAGPDLLKAKQEAEAKGYIFFTSHEEIVAEAKKEGKLRVNSGLEPQTFKPLINGFKQNYPFLTDVQVEELSGSNADERFLVEIKLGQAKGWDISRISHDFAKDYVPYLMKHEILGMAKQGVLKIEPRMVHPLERNMVSATSTIRAVVYNRKLLPEEQVPAKWEDFLKPEFRERKFVLDVHPTAVAALVPAWGMERTLDFARKLAAQQPVWGRVSRRITTAILAGEYALYWGPNFNIVESAMGKDPTGTLGYKIIEPVPTMSVWHVDAILKTADHPNVALLWLEFLASPEGQAIIDKHEPLRASVFTAGSATEQATRGKKLSMIDWDHFTRFQQYIEKVFAAYGFPKAEK